MTEATIQHFLPRFLIAGFASRQSKAEKYAWVFTKSRPPFEANVRGIAAERFFYGKPGETDVESALAEREGLYSSVLQRVVMEKAVADELRAPLAEFMANITIRIASFRSSFADGASAWMQLVAEMLAHPDLHRFTIENLPALVDTHLEDPELKARLGCDPAKPVPTELKGLILRSASQPQALAAMRHFLANAAGMLTSFPFAEYAKRGHIQALDKDLAPPKRVADYLTLNWVVHEVPEPCIVLSDSGLLVGAPNQAFTLPIFAPGPYPHVFLPLSPTSLLVGSRPDAPGGTVDVNQLNRASAQLSMRQFIASRNTEWERQHAPFVGAQCTIVSTEELEAGRAEIFSKLASGKIP